MAHTCKVTLTDEQMTFWDSPLSPEKNLWLEIYNLKEKHNNVRRGLFGRHESLKKEVAELKKQIEELRTVLNYGPEEKIHNLYFEAVN